MINTTHPRERLIQTAATLVQRQGWTSTGINQILTEAGIPKGSFYYYFRSKEALGVAVLQRHYTRFHSIVESTLKNESLEPVEALTRFTTELASGQFAADFMFGCPAGNLASEVATQCPALLTEAMRTIELYREGFASVIRRAQTTGHQATSEKRNVDADAQVATYLMQGALTAVKCTQSLEPLERARMAIGQFVLFAEVAPARPHANVLSSTAAMAS